MSQRNESSKNLKLLKEDKKLQVVIRYAIEVLNSLKNKFFGDGNNNDSRYNWNLKSISSFCEENAKEKKYKTIISILRPIYEEFDHIQNNFNEGFGGDANIMIKINEMIKQLKNYEHWKWKWKRRREVFLFHIKIYNYVYLLLTNIILIMVLIAKQ